METIEFRNADEADIPFLLDLRIRTMHRHAVASGDAPSRADHMQRVLKRFECAKIIVVDGVDAGLLKLDADQRPWHLIQIQLASRYHRRGIGTRILTDIVEDARAVGVSVRLSVLATNPARRLYERLGFSTVRESSRSLEMVLPDHVEHVPGSV